MVEKSRAATAQSQRTSGQAISRIRCATRPAARDTSRCNLRLGNLRKGRSALCVLFKELARVAEGQDRLGSIVRDLATELFLEGHHQFDGVEAVGAEVVNEAGGIRHLLGFDAEMLHHDLFDPLGNITHRFHPRIFLMGLRRATRAVAASWWRKTVCDCTPRGIDRWQIGRASCRERGEISQVAVSLKKEDKE